MELWALVLFHRAGTNALPTLPTTAVVEAGPYRFSRNPIYSAAPPSTAFGSSPSSRSSTQVVREEAYLTRKFGAPYMDYAARVRRWL